MIVGKKAQVEETMLTAAKMVFAVITILIVIYASVKLGGIFLSKEKTQAELDFERIVGEIEDLQKDETIDVPVATYGYWIFLIDKENPALPSECRKKSCICLYPNGADVAEQCERFRKFESYKFPELCRGEIKCLKDSKVEVTKGQNVVTLVSDNNIIEIR